jgi:hypothetical protein
MANPSSIQGLLKTNVPPYQDGINKAAFFPVFRAHVLEVRSAQMAAAFPSASLRTGLRTLHQAQGMLF